MYVSRHRGMGDAAYVQGPQPGLFQSLEVPMTPDGIALCKSLGFYFTPGCWYMAKSAWEEASSFEPLIPTAPVAPAAIASGLSTEPAPLTAEEADQQTSDVLNAAMAATQAANLAASQNQPTVCGPGQALAEDGVTCVATASNWMIYGALALVAVFAVVSLGSGSPRRYGR